MNSPRKLRLDLARYYRLPSVQVSLGVVLAFLISALLIMFAIRPTFATIVALNKEIKETRETVSLLEKKVTALNRAVSILETIKPNLPTLERSIPGDGVGYDELTRGLEALAQNTGATLETVTVGKSIVSSRLVTAYIPDKKQEVAETPISIRVRGDYPALSGFLTRLLGTVRLTSVESVALLKDGGKASRSAASTEGELNLTINGAVLYTVDPGAMGKVFPSNERGK